MTTDKMSDNKTERNAIFFLGAGASAHAGIPTVRPMTQAFIDSLRKAGSDDCSRSLDKLMGQLAKRRSDPDIEIILQTLHRLIDYQGDELSAFLGQDTGFDRAVLLKLRRRLEAFIRVQTIQPSNIDYLRPLLDPVFGSPTDIFSVNYDTCIELLCRDMQRRLIDGFTPEWNPRSLESDDWRIHITQVTS